MKTFKEVIRNELRELLNQKLLINFLFFGIVFLDALGAIFPQYLNRQITMFIPFPLIFIIYILNANRKNKLFLLSLILNFLGICNFNNPYEKYNSTGLIYHTIAFFIYFIILCKHFKKVNVKIILKISIPLVVLVLIPLIIYSEGMTEMLVFHETVLYVFSATVFVFSAFLIYLETKTKANYLLIFSAVSIFFSSCLQGYNLFINRYDLFQFFAVILFNLTHYLMCWHLIKKDNKK